MSERCIFYCSSFSVISLKHAPLIIASYFVSMPSSPCFSRASSHRCLDFAPLSVPFVPRDISYTAFFRLPIMSPSHLSAASPQWLNITSSVLFIPWYSFNTLFTSSYHMSIPPSSRFCHFLSDVHHRAFSDLFISKYLWPPPLQPFLLRVRTASFIFIYNNSVPPYLFPNKPQQKLSDTPFVLSLKAFTRIFPD